MTLPPGAIYINNFLSPGEEADITRLLDEGRWNSDLKRRVQHFGYRYDYKARAVTQVSYLGPLP